MDYNNISDSVPSSIPNSIPNSLSNVICCDNVKHTCRVYNVKEPPYCEIRNYTI